MDSGASNNVMPRRMVRDKTKIKDSWGSRNGVNYVAANNGKIKNEGEVDFEFQTAEGDDEMLTIQIAEVNKALGSISYLVDRGYRITFDKDIKSGRDLSHMVKKVGNRITRFRRERNVWVLDAYVPVDPNQDFSRRG